MVEKLKGRDKRDHINRVVPEWQLMRVSLDHRECWFLSMEFRYHGWRSIESHDL
jgi:hypothetical protein